MGKRTRKQSRQDVSRRNTNRPTNPSSSSPSVVRYWKPILAVGVFCLAAIWFWNRESELSPRPPVATPLSANESRVTQAAAKPIPIYRCEVVKTFPHDRNAYCQGLVFADGGLLEGTGRYGKSTLRKVDLETGRVTKTHLLNRRYFGEGITLWENQIIQLTWKENTAIVYDKDTFQFAKRFRYPGEGWGLTHDGKQLIMSDGTNVLRFLDPKTFKILRRLPVRAQGARIVNLNELEYVKGEIYANIWQRDWIARIDPATGQVVGWIDVSGLLKRNDYFSDEQIPNGIAYDPDGDRLFVTGKWWPKLFQVKLVPKTK
ncbi:MAG: glutaminyl-peptide cyclotransferase [Planctomycetales bacterium]